MYSIAMDVGKYRTYGIVERDGEITKEGFQSFMDGIDHATVIDLISMYFSMLPAAFVTDRIMSCSLSNS